MTTLSVADDLVAGIRRWVEIESPTHDAAGVQRNMDLVAEEARAAGIGVEAVPGKDGLAGSLILRSGPARSAGSQDARMMASGASRTTGSQDRGILVMSHLDTVHPVGTLARDLPFRQEGDRLYGPGIYDMKAGAYLAFRAFLDVARSGEAKLPLTYLFTPDEEIGSPTTRGLIEDLGRRAAYALVTEPAREGGKVVTARKGVGRFDVEVEGRPSHAGSRHPDGRSAIREAALQVTAIEGLTDYAKGVTTTVGLISGGTAANVIPQHCRFQVDLRVVNAADGEAYANRILGLKPVGSDVAVRITGGMNRPPYERTLEIGKLFERAQSLAADISLDLREVPMTGGGSDGNFTAALGVPTLDGLGADGDGAHTLHEHALVSSLVPRMRLMASLLTNLS